MKISDSAIGWIMIIVCFTGVIVSGFGMGVAFERHRNASRMEARQEAYTAQVDSIGKVKAVQAAVISPNETRAATDTVVSEDPTIDDILDRLLILEKEIPSLKKHLLADHAELRAIHVDIKNSGILEEIEAITDDTTRAKRNK